MSGDRKDRDWKSRTQKGMITRSLHEERKRQMNINFMVGNGGPIVVATNGGLVSWKNEE